MGGHLAVMSKVGEGSVFSFSIKCKRADVSRASDAALPASPSPGRPGEAALGPASADGSPLSSQTPVSTAADEQPLDRGGKDSSSSSSSSCKLQCGPPSTTTEASVPTSGPCGRREQVSADELAGDTARCTSSAAAQLGGAEGAEIGGDTRQRSAETSDCRPKILLAEDNKVNVMVAMLMLKRLGFTAKVVNNGLEALEAIRQEPYDLLLLDISMPLMDGLQVAYLVRRYEETGVWSHEIAVPVASGSAVEDSSGAVAAEEEGKVPSERERTPGSRVEAGSAPQQEEEEDSNRRAHTRRLPIVAVTANALTADVEKCFAYGMDAFIAKPVMFPVLKDVLSRYLPVKSDLVHSTSSASVSATAATPQTLVDSRALSTTASPSSGASSTAQTALGCRTAISPQTPSGNVAAEATAPLSSAPHSLLPTPSDCRNPTV
ncbi:hypothetical protein CBR_g23017 [Chara braunii]|uniref:Response regulatory domain-containing protein n=1 Tax=Chara braunii TaxID=69332 RepID=A0A388L3H6_CHABU|nr:hypothetical protein CBR_g23017 [Chara braunii]|eukprot:GBG76802.1 hypothetical protein CBR_g23017 [Chara braunii]